MTELERRALLGDPEALRECTEKGIVLPCQFCGSKYTQVRYMGWENYPSPFEAGYRGECTDCHALTGAYKTKEEALVAWNTRPAPPIGRCGECKHSSCDEEYGNRWCNLNLGSRIVGENDYCGHFKQKEREENAVD